MSEIQRRRTCVSGKEISIISETSEFRRVINTRSWKFSATVLRHTARTRIAFFMHFCHLTRAPPPPALAHDLACAVACCQLLSAVHRDRDARSLAPRKTSTCGSCSVNARPGTSCLPLACPLPPRACLPNTSAPVPKCQRVSPIPSSCARSAPTRTRSACAEQPSRVISLITSNQRPRGRDPRAQGNPRESSAATWALMTRAEYSHSEDSAPRGR